MNLMLVWVGVPFIRFSRKFTMVDDQINFRELVPELVPEGNKLNFNHFVQWFAHFDPSFILSLLKRRAACILQRNQHGADFLIPFFISREDDI
jgi:hypothetical protein